MINLRYSLTADEYKGFIYYTGWQSPERKNYRLKYYAVPLVLYGVGTSLLLFSMGKFHLDPTLLTIVAAVLILLTIYLHYRIKSFYPNQVGKLIKESGENKILPEMEFTLSEVGIAVKTSEEDIKYTWNAILKKVEVNACYYLYLNSRQGLVIPKRVFKDQREEKEFRDILARFLPLQAEFRNVIK